MLQGEGRVRFGRKGQLPGEHLEHDDANGIDIGGGRWRIARGLFRGKILRRAPHLIILDLLAGFAHGASDAKIGHLDPVITRDQDILRFDITVNEVGAVGVADAVTYLDGQVEEAAGGHELPVVVILADDLLQGTGR